MIYLSSFRDSNRKEKTATVVAIAILIIMVVGFVFCLYLFGMAGFFKLFGVQYNSAWSLVLFVAGFFVLGIIVELFTEAIFKLSIRNMTGKSKVFLIRIGFESASNWLVLFTVDEFMGGITLSLEVEIIIALLLAVIEASLDGDKDKPAKEG